MAENMRRSRKAGRVMAEAIIEMVHLMYQNKTAWHFLSGLHETIVEEINRRSAL